jgi:hypothetical protein
MIDFSEHSGLFRFVPKQFCLFQLFRYRFETPKQTENFFFWFHETNRNKRETDLVSVCFGSNGKFFFFHFEDTLGETHPVSSSIVHSSYRYGDDFGRDLSAISRPRGGFFHNFDFETVLPLSKTTAGRNLPVLLRFVLCPTRSSVFCSGKTFIQSRSILSC